MRVWGCYNQTAPHFPAVRSGSSSFPLLDLVVTSKSKALSKTTIEDDRRRHTFWKVHQGRHPKIIDRALPQRHTRRLYDSLGHEDASILAQLRTGKARLNSNLYRINAADTDLCNLCGRSETVHHFLYDCARWAIERVTHLKTVGTRWGDMSYMLGGWFNEQLDGPRNR